MAETSPRDTPETARRRVSVTVASAARCAPVQLAIQA
jgi:hypothetical protein